jgi:hypothetical protein
MIAIWTYLRFNGHQRLLFLAGLARSGFMNAL